MRLKSTRSLAEMRQVMMDPQATGPDPVYQVFTDLGDHFWVNKTVIYPGRLGKEFSKTMGHYHEVNISETYFVAEGNGVLMLQNDERVYAIKAAVGDRVTITKEFGHSWSNIDDAQLVLFDDWAVPHSPTDYAWVEIEHGMAYYLIDDNGEIKPLPNPHYVKCPEAVWLTGEEFART